MAEPVVILILMLLTGPPYLTGTRVVVLFIQSTFENRSYERAWSRAGWPAGQQERDRVGIASAAAGRVRVAAPAAYRTAIAAP